MTLLETLRAHGLSVALPGGGELLVAPLWAPGRREYEFAQLIHRAIQGTEIQDIFIPAPQAHHDAYAAAAARSPAVSVLRTERPPHPPRVQVLTVCHPAIATLRAVGRHRPAARVLPMGPPRQDSSAQSTHGPDPLAWLSRDGHQGFDAWLDAHAQDDQANGPAGAGDDRRRFVAKACAAILAARPRGLALALCPPEVARDLRRAIAEAETETESRAEVVEFGSATHELGQLHADDLRHALPTPGRLLTAFERAESPQTDSEPGAVVVDLFSRRVANPTPAPRPVSGARDRSHLLIATCFEAAEALRTRGQRGPDPGGIVRLWNYATKYALLGGRLAPDAYELCVACRGFGGEEFAHEVWLRLTEPPPQPATVDLPTFRVGASELGRVRTLSMRPRPRLRAMRMPAREDEPGAWAEAFGGDGLVSHGGDDRFFARFAEQLRSHATRGGPGSRSTSVPLETSLLDGIDVRATARNLARGRIFVRSEAPESRSEGAIVVIFEDEALALHDHPGRHEPEAERYPWMLTWQGERPQEGDLALFGTDPFEDTVGPGIGRGLYGGLLAVRPSQTLFGVWREPEWQDAPTKGEVLLRAALEADPDRRVIHCAATPPSTRWRRIAESAGGHLVHVPLSSLDLGTVNRTRAFHVLAGEHVRAYADRYIHAPDRGAF